MSQHTKEPWHDSDHPLDNVSGVFESIGIPFEDWKRAVQCVNGCTGLNPTAYRECVEALKLIVQDWEDDDQATHGLAGIVGAPSWVAKANDAIAHAEQKK